MLPVAFISKQLDPHCPGMVPLPTCPGGSSFSIRRCKKLILDRPLTIFSPHHLLTSWLPHSCQTLATLGSSNSPLLTHPCLLPVSDTPCPMLDWPHPLWPLPITTLAILFAIGLAVMAPPGLAAHTPTFTGPYLPYHLFTTPGVLFLRNGLTWPYVSGLP